VRAGVHHARSVVHTHHRAPAMQAIVNVHAVTVDRSNLSVGTDARGTTTPQRNIPDSRRRMTGCARVATRRGVSAFGRMATLRGVATLRRVSAALRGVATLRRVSALRGVATL